MPGLNTFLKRRRQRLYSSKVMAEDVSGGVYTGIRFTRTLTESTCEQEEEECLRPQTPSSDGGSLPHWVRFLRVSAPGDH